MERQVARALTNVEFDAAELPYPMPEHCPDTDTTSREHLLDVAESLFLSEGIDKASLRSIVRAAGHKNPSALQYHFGNREGVINAIVARRVKQQEARRTELFSAVSSDGHSLSLRDICAIQVGAPYLLCREDASFKEVLGVFGLRLLTTDVDYFTAQFSEDVPTLLTLWQLGAHYLDHLPPTVLALRIENTHGAAMLALSRRARAKGSFRGRVAELFYNDLVDGITAVLSAPLSENTRALVTDKHNGKDGTDKLTG